MPRKETPRAAPEPEKTGARESRPDESGVFRSERPKAPETERVVEVRDDEVSLRADWVPEGATFSSFMHPDRNEDAVLGDATRLVGERAKPPMIDTGAPEFDLARVEEARMKEAKWAKLFADRRGVGVLDGISGPRAEFEGLGAVASRIASAAIVERVASLREDPLPEEVEEALVAALKNADEDIAKHARLATAAIKESLDPKMRKAELQSIGTTAAVAVESNDHDGRRKITIGRVGDSRVYFYDEAKGTLRAVTVDENKVGAMLLREQITREEYDVVMAARDNEAIPEALREKVRLVTEMSPLQARSMLTNSLGYGGAKVKLGQQVKTYDFPPGRRLILTSDGVHDNLTDAELLALLKEGKTAADIAEVAFERSQRRDGKPDDISIVDVGGESKDRDERELLRDAQGGVQAAYDLAQQPAARGAPPLPKKDKGVVGWIKGLFS